MKPLNRALFVFILVTAVSAVLRYSHSGLRSRVVGEDELGARAAGVRIHASRYLPFIVSAFITGVAGGLFASYLGAFSPATFDLSRGVIVIVIVVLGGTKSITGAITGAVVISIWVEVSRRLAPGFSLGPLQVPGFAGLRDLTMGLALIVLLIRRPQGLLGNRELQIVRISASRRTDSSSGAVCDSSLHRVGQGLRAEDLESA